MNIFKLVRDKTLQFSNFWLGIRESRRHVLLVIIPLIAGGLLTLIANYTHRAVEQYFGPNIGAFWFIVYSTSLFVFIWLLAILIEDRRKIQEQTCRDYLTGVYTRRFTYEEAVKQVAEASRSQKIICVCFVDLDNLKPINDTYSHAAGDEALVLVGQTLLDAVRINDLVGRYGGDEFLLIWTTTNKEAINETLKRITDGLGSMLLKWRNQEIVITASVGLSHGYCEPKGDPEKTLKDLIKQADDVLKGTKKYKR